MLFFWPGDLKSLKLKMATDKHLLFRTLEVGVMYNKIVDQIFLGSNYEKLKLA